MTLKRETCAPGRTQRSTTPKYNFSSFSVLFSFDSVERPKFRAHFWRTWSASELAALGPEAYQVPTSRGATRLLACAHYHRCSALTLIIIFHSSDNTLRHLLLLLLPSFLFTFFFNKVELAACGGRVR
jgi:hypothetical protein